MKVVTQNRNKYRATNSISNLSRHFIVILSLLLLSISFRSGDLHAQDIGWYPRELNFNRGISSIYFVDANTGWVVGEDQVIMKTSDGGDSWITQHDRGFASFTSVHFVNANKGFALGHKSLAKTTDAGVTWEIEETDFFGREMFFISENIGWISISTEIYKTTDGGISWTEFPSFTDKLIGKFHFADSNTGMAIGGLRIFRTTNGGTTWEDVSPAEALLGRSVYLISSTVGWVVGPLSSVYKTIDGGNTWITVSDASNPTISGNHTSVFFHDESVGLIVGEGLDSRGSIYRTIDGGENWEETKLSSLIRDVYCVSGTDCWALGNGIFKYGVMPLTLTSPVGGEMYIGGTVQEFTWISSGLVDSVDIYFTATGGRLWFKIRTLGIPASDESFSWIVPSVSGEYFIKVVDQSFMDLYVTHEDPFIVFTPVTILSPTGGEIYGVGSTQDITWNVEFVDNVRIEYTVDDEVSWTTIVESIAADVGIYSWTVPELALTEYKIRITDTAHADRFATGGTFTLNTDVMFTRYEFYTDVAAHSSNPFNFVAPGRIVRFKIQAANNFTQNLLTLKGTITSDNPYVTITDSIGSFNNILVSQEGWSDDVFEISISADIPNDTELVFVLKIADEIVADGPWLSQFSIPVIIRPFIISRVLMDDDDNPDSKGNDNDIAEPGETIEVIPLLDNVSRHAFFNISGLITTPIPELNIWNGVTGASGTVNNTYRYNVISNSHRAITAELTNVTPEEDFVFDYNLSNTNRLWFDMIMSGYADAASNNGGVLMKWTTSFQLNLDFPPLVGVEDEESFIPDKYTLEQNYPNPFNPETVIEYALPIQGNVSLIVYDLRGQEVARLINGVMPAGNHSVTWDASNVSSGIYFYRLTAGSPAGDFVQTRKMLLLR